MAREFHCPLGYERGVFCYSVRPSGFGCPNFEKCAEYSRTAFMLPYYYDHDNKCLTVDDSSPYEIVWDSNFPESDSAYSPGGGSLRYPSNLSEDAAKMFRNLGFCIAERNPYYYPHLSQPDDSPNLLEDEDDIPF